MSAHTTSLIFFIAFAASAILLWRAFGAERAAAIIVPTLTAVIAVEVHVTHGLNVSLAIALISALLWHRVVTSYIVGVFGATVTVVFAYQIAVYIDINRVDPFLPFSVVVTSAIAAVVAALVGLPFSSRRKANASRNREL